jgi:uncharacterized SAM-binding protein YcdF (DUF218 family)
VSSHPFESRATRPGGIRRILRWLLPLAAAFGLLFAAITFLPILNPWTSALSAPWADPEGDILIVLGGDAGADGVLGLSSYWRAVYAVFSWRHSGYREVVISGGAGVAESMRDFLLSYGIPRETLRLESRSETTREQAVFVAEMLRNTPGRKILLTSDYHSGRASRAFRKAGLDVIASPFPDARKRSMTLSQRWSVFLDLTTETSKVIWYRLHGWT